MADERISFEVTTKKPSRTIIIVATVPVNFYWAPCDYLYFIPIYTVKYILPFGNTF